MEDQSGRGSGGGNGFQLPGNASGSSTQEPLPLPLAFLIAGALANGGPPAGPAIRLDGINRPERGGGPSLVLFTMPGGGGLMSAATMPGGQEGSGSFPLPMGILAGLGGPLSQMSAPGPGDPNSNSGEEPGLPDVLGGAMQAMMDQMARIIIERSMDDTGATVPPANESVRDALPRVVVTKEDLIDSNNSRCSVCLEDFRPGSRATRMLCGHLFCTVCIREWLREANSCPICRYELATDLEEFETGRKKRMRGRLARLRVEELRMLRVPELRKLMKALGVSADGCIEKAELLEQLARAPDVEVAPEESSTEPAKRLRYEAKELENLELPLLHNLMERHRVPFDAVTLNLNEEEERKVALKCFADSGWLRDSKPPTDKESGEGVPLTPGKGHLSPEEASPPTRSLSKDGGNADRSSFPSKSADGFRTSDCSGTTAEGSAASSTGDPAQTSEVATPSRPRTPAPSVRRPHIGPQPSVRRSRPSAPGAELPSPES
eukprot:TRINITY_DN4120_c0_g1_i2.p1 TRINITY_DN4120_c0_g1~~TRINITY_DN4120_c0_g1_i2.p1  ORF type:complete len:492 (+),score=81.69 TRINITY_DN4120_c0_g1_i2:224-1699(+)